MNMSMSLSSTRAPIPYAALHANKLPAANIQTPASRTRREIAGDPPAAGLPWTRLPNRERDRVLAAEAQLAERMAAAEDEGYTLVEVPPDSRLGPAMRLYQHLLNRPLLQQWIAGQGLEPATLTVHRDRIEGYVNHNGVRSAASFSLTDNSGWNEVSRTLSPIRELLDPADQGLPFVEQGKGLWLPHQRVAQVDVSRLESVWQVIGDLEERYYLADRLEKELEPLPDNARTDWSTHPTELSPASPLPAHSQAAMERLQRLVARPEMVSLLAREGFDWPGKPFRVSEGRLERQSPVGGWVDLSRYVEAVDTLNDELTALTTLAEPLGNAVYSTPRYDMRQLLDFKGLGSPRTVAQTRNVIDWLRTSLPPAPVLGDYDGLIKQDWAPGSLTPDDKNAVAALAGIRLGGAHPRLFGALTGFTLQAMQADPQAHLDKLLDSLDALAFGEQLAYALRWQGGQGNASVLPKALRQQLVIAAIKLHVDPSMPDKPGEIAGYSIYQPANMGRSFSEVRRDIERHLQESKGLDPKLAVLAAQVCLAQAAPELLVRDVPASVHIGTPAWVELRLGCALADHNTPGTSRMMSEQQVTALTTLMPTNEGQATLMQLSALKIIADWAVLNGVVRQRSDGEYSAYDIQDAARAFFKQRQEASSAFANASLELPTRKTLAIKELLRAFPDSTQAELERMTVTLASAEDRRNLPVSEPRFRSLVETYMTGDLTPGKWVFSDDAPVLSLPVKTPSERTRSPEVSAEARDRLDKPIRYLPELDGLLKTAVNQHHKNLQSAYATKLKLMFAQLPLADRQALEVGKVELFTLRLETGVTEAEETDEYRDAKRARQGTLMRLEHAKKVVYYEVFANGSLIRRTDLPEAVKLNGTARWEQVLGDRGPDYCLVVRGAQMAVDFDAYATGSNPRPNVIEPAVIVEPLGAVFPARELPGNLSPQTFVPDTYGSRRTSSIADRISQGNFYEPLEAMQQRAREPLPLEERREARERTHAFLLGFVPFVGAYQEFKQGNIGQGMTNLVVDAVGVAIGAGSQARGLIRSAKALVANPVSRLITRFKPSAATLTSAKSMATFSDCAFDFIKRSTLFTNAALNPLDGFPQLLSAATKGLVKVPALLVGAGTKWSKAAPHLLTAEEKLRTYLLASAGQASGTDAPTVSSTVARAGRYQGVDVQAVQYNHRWYSINPRSGQAYGTPLSGFLPKE